MASQLAVTGGTADFFNGIDVTPAVLSMVGGSVAIGVVLDSNLIGRDIRLDRLQRSVPVIDNRGFPTMQHQAAHQKMVESIEQAFADDQLQIDDLRRILESLQAVQNAQAETAQQVSAVQKDLALVNSSTNPVDGLLSATSSGVVTILAHNRDYGDGTIVSVDGGTVTGFTEDQFIRVFYDDSAREGGTVVYQGTTGEVTQTGNRHVIGGVLIPMAGEPPSTGVGTTPPGYVRDDFR
jgi:hypothetical protein